MKQKKKLNNKRETRIKGIKSKTSRVNLKKQ